jgi:tartrate-resistant acid phosphatase type 5
MLRPVLILSMLMMSVMAIAGTKTSFVAFGDSGYHYDYLKPDIYAEPMTPEQYLADELASWLEKHLPTGEFQAPPMYILPQTNQAIEASGANAVGDAMYNYCTTSNCQFAIMLGDNIYPYGATGVDDDLRFRKIFERPYLKLTNSQPNFKLYAALGNHDWKTSREGRESQITYGMREDTAFTIQAPGYYRFTKGEVEFFIIDTNLLLAGTKVKEAELNPDGSEMAVEEDDLPEPWELPNEEDKKQLAWLEQSLKSSKAKWKVVYGHHTLWSAGGSKFEEAKALRRLITPLVCKYADIYIAGHEHELEVNLDTCQQELGSSDHPLPLVVSGAGAWQRPVHHPFQTFQEIKYPQYKALWSKGMVWGFSHFEITGEKMVVKMITTPVSGTGVPIVEKSFSFSNRSQLINN